MTNLVDLLEMKVLEQRDGFLKMSMPVKDQVKQPFGYLHGGATMALGETACSMGSANLVDTTKEIPVGLEMHTNHIKSATDGYIYAEATILHQGRSTHVWDIRITDDEGRLISVMRGTLMIKKITK
ncbi:MULTISPECIES: PaaI family thioesterase [unclassified Staphylococcus]|uniref:PaaI family thioesterase n=1 Tax=unclassified Staphylococcus TaxID=91994 RepID=UPI0021D0C46A|nr:MULTISPECIES: PaaI family thioesterase [unclassified Staphylococcus]UXR70072.1 PaaI family thioesterase [Staphylococcus sp. IVB6246]UXR72130.1 PaaI family thioesterase [Staphylococcus sp. IVB6240]UXR74438.1 PaaI family thioesterase [Staphylococcus sp. IVB6238]UXR76823.1 PaaI family thioesterase [Staphylococcus sp. IVB6233]UXR80951.1 PaaI family thioesterase [Staphylococcus sp. IVB6218]